LQKDIRVVRFIDSGRFSNVFEAALDQSLNSSWTQHDGGDSSVYWGSSSAPTSAILKVLKHTFSGKVKREIRILELLKDVRGVVRLLGASKNSAVFPKTVGLLFEYLPDTQWLAHLHVPDSPSITTTTATAAAPQQAWTLAEIRFFFYKLLCALAACHARGVMHRDVKPRNVVVQRRGSKQLRLIDFGLSEMYSPGARYNPSVASRHFKCPELLVGYEHYDFGVDIWAAGCILAGLIFHLEPFFFGTDTEDQLAAIAAVVGSEALLGWVNKYKIKLPSSLRQAIGRHADTPLHAFRNANNAHLCCDEALDLLGKMLCVDHVQRATASECLAHPFFDSVRASSTL